MYGVITVIQDYSKADWSRWDEHRDPEREPIQAQEAYSPEEARAVSVYYKKQLKSLKERKEKEREMRRDLRKNYLQRRKNDLWRKRITEWLDKKADYFFANKKSIPFMNENMWFFNALYWDSRDKLRPWEMKNPKMGENYDYLDGNMIVHAVACRKVGKAMEGHIVDAYAVLCHHRRRFFKIKRGNYGESI